MSWRNKTTEQATDPVQDEELRKLLALYLDKDDEAFDVVSDTVSEDPERAWRFLQLACEADLPLEHMAYLSAGPFENLMGLHGQDFIERVEDAARRDAAMRVLLSLVWREGMSAAIWSRVETLRAKLRIQLQ